MTEKAVLVGVATPQQNARDTREHLDELARLAVSAGAEVVGEVYQSRPSFDSATLIGSGKVRELKELVVAKAAVCVIFDDDLTGSQAKHLEKEIGVKIVDRSGLILDIFARNARTHESRLQVEIAQLDYLLPRLTQAWSHLSRQTGGIGTRGPGETQLETDRRIVRDRLSDLKRKLKEIERARAGQLERRRNSSFNVALAGYTNAGKSTLLNALTKSKVLAENRLFSTLDATSRRLWLGHGKEAVLSDTVGFIRKLPHRLVASFRSTLAVVSGADLVVHLVDATDAFKEDHMRVTSDVLDELSARDIPRLLVFNKIDLLDGPDRDRIEHVFARSVRISAGTGEGIDELREEILRQLDSWQERRRGGQARASGAEARMQEDADSEASSGAPATPSAALGDAEAPPAADVAARNPIRASRGSMDETRSEEDFDA